MLRSMYSGITGLRNFQTKLDVIGNNISNVNTYGFKKGRTVFKDLVSQTVAGASAPGMDRGGVNPKQVGLGSQLATIDTLHGQGSTQFTGNTLDLAISGDGFFIVNDGGEDVYTRAGNFYMDRDGRLVDGDGRFVQGQATTYNNVGVTWTGNPPVPTFTGGEAVGRTNRGEINIPITASSMSIGQDGTVYYVDYLPGARNLIDEAERELQAAQKVVDDKEAENKADPNRPGPTQADLDKLAEWKAKSEALKGKYKGELMVAGRISMAKFSNPGGLEKVGGNLFRQSANSGNAEVEFATAQGFGTIESGFVEMSNVDLAEEFTEMIVAQRGFQANTRIITTSDEILQELVNLKR